MCLKEKPFVKYFRNCSQYDFRCHLVLGPCHHVCNTDIPGILAQGPARLERLRILAGGTLSAEQEAFPTHVRVPRMPQVILKVIIFFRVNTMVAKALPKIRGLTTAGFFLDGVYHVVFFRLEAPSLLQRNYIDSCIRGRVPENLDSGRCSQKPLTSSRV